MKRFEFDADSLKEAHNYIENRSIQLLKYDVSFISTNQVDDLGLDVTFSYDKTEYHGIYVLKSNRGKGKYESYVKEKGYQILTHKDCKISDFLKNKDIPFIQFGSFENTLEYKWIQEEYGDKKSNRSNVYLMNHIDEGLKILFDIGASDNAKLAYCIHPIFQGDYELSNIQNNEYFWNIDREVIINVMEYRSVANEYLSKREIKSINDIRLSPLKDVNDMLIADKVQNYKDFEVYHKNTHPRSKELDQYFKNWLERLDITTHRYQMWSHKLLSTLEL